MAGNETARREAIVIVHSITPDACFLPSGAVANYFIVSSGIHAMKVCKDVNATSSPVMNMNSILSTCSNDQAAIAGVVSGTVIGIVEPIENVCRVKANGSHVLRDGDIVWMNTHNCLGIVKILFPKKLAILATPKTFAEKRALQNLADLHPGADVIDPSKTSPDLSQYEDVIVHGHGGQLMGSRISPQQLAQFLNDHGFQGSSVELAGCHTGTSFPSPSASTPGPVSGPVPGTTATGTSLPGPSATVPASPVGVPGTPTATPPSASPPVVPPTAAPSPGASGTAAPSTPPGRPPYAERLSEILGIPVTGYPHEILVIPGAIVSRINLTGNDVVDGQVTAVIGALGGAKSTPITFPAK